MKYKLPRFTLIPLGLVPVLACAVFAQTPSAQQLVEQAARNIAQERSVEAKIRQRVELFGKFLVGNGSYRQLTIGERQWFRLEMRLQVADRLTSLLKVSDDKTLWIRHDYADRQTFAYVDLDRVRTAASAFKGTGRAEGVLAAGQGIAGYPSPNLALGGLHQLLAGLNASFEFSPPVPAKIGDQPVWQLTGHWKPSMLSQLMPGLQAGMADRGRADPAKLPLHLPTEVVLALGRDDQMPLFPYRIEYRRRTPTPTAASDAGVQLGATDRPIATMELFEVRRYVDMDRRDFAFQPADEPVEDRTSAFLERLGLPVEKSE